MAQLRFPSPNEVRKVLTAFQHAHGDRPRLLQPRTFSEFIQRRKLFDGNRLYSIFCDKIRVRDFVRERCGDNVLIPMQWHGHARDIPFDALQYPVIVKPSHLAGKVAILRTRPHANAAAELMMLARRWRKLNHGRINVEPGYTPVKRQLLAENLLLDETGSVPTDYKFYSFRGRVEMIQVQVGRFSDDHRLALFDRNWRRLPIAWKRQSYVGILPRPPMLSKMIEVAETLTQGFQFLRADLYAVADRVYFGEITVYPGSGMKPMNPPIWDRYLGDVWRGRRHLDDEPVLAGASSAPQ